MLTSLILIGEFGDPEWSVVGYSCFSPAKPCCIGPGRFLTALTLGNYVIDGENSPSLMNYNPGQNCWNSIHLFSQI